MISVQIVEVERFDDGSIKRVTVNTWPITVLLVALVLGIGLVCHA